jgi:hypothetical protein
MVAQKSRRGKGKGGVEKWPPPGQAGRVKDIRVRALA